MTCPRILLVGCSLLFVLQTVNADPNSYSGLGYAAVTSIHSKYDGQKSDWKSEDYADIYVQYLDDAREKRCNRIISRVKILSVGNNNDKEYGVTWLMGEVDAKKLELGRQLGKLFLCLPTANTDERCCRSSADSNIR